MQYRTLLIVCLTLLAQLSRAQFSGPEKFNVKPLVGSHLYYEKGSLFQDHFYGLDLAAHVDLKNHTDAWIKQTGAKSYGLSFLYRNFERLKGVRDTSINAFGQAYGLVAEMEFQLLRLGNLKLLFTPGVGLSYTNKTFFNHPRNITFGSHFNEAIKADLGLELPINPNWSIAGGLGFLHLSNGGIIIPNGGLNTGNAYLQLKYQTTKESATARASTFKVLEQNAIELQIGFGARGAVGSQTEKFHRMGIYAGYNYFYKPLLSFKGGLDGIYNFTRYRDADKTGTYQYYGSSYDHWRLGASIGADLRLWRVSLSANVGKYLYFNKLFKEASWYWNFAPSFHISPRLAIQAKTHMHFAQAEYINYGLAYKF